MKKTILAVFIASSITSAVYGKGNYKKPENHIHKSNTHSLHGSGRRRNWRTKPFKGLGYSIT